MFTLSQVKKIIFLLTFILFALIFLFFISLPQDRVNSQASSCNPNILSADDLFLNRNSDNIKNFNSCLSLLGFYFGDISDKYDGKTVDALKKFYLNIRRYDSLEDYTYIKVRSENIGNYDGDFRLIKDMAKMKVAFGETQNLNPSRSFRLDNGYVSLDKLVVDEKFDNILVSYRAKNNKFYIQKINIPNNENAKLSRFFDLIKGFDFIDGNGNYYLNYFLKNRNYFLVTSPNGNSFYGPFEDIGDFKVYNTSTLGMFYLKNRFTYGRLGNYRIGPFVNAFNLKLSPYEPKIAAVLSDPRLLERVGEPTGYYVYLRSLVTSTLISGFSSVANFDFAEEDIPYVSYGGFVFTYKPLWQNITSDPNMIENFLKDWVYIEGNDSPCKDFQTYYGLISRASEEHQALLTKLYNFENFCNANIIPGTNPIINKEYLEKVIARDYSNLLTLNKKIEGPLSVCGPYNVIYNTILSPDRTKLAIVYAKDYFDNNGVKQIKQGIAVVNLTKSLDLSSSPSCPPTCDNNSTIDVSSLIKSCYQNLARIVYSQSVGQMNFYSPIEFDQSLGAVFSNDGSKLAFSYRNADRYYLTVFNYPSTPLAASISPAYTSIPLISPIEVFEFSSDGKIFAFLGETENTLGEKVKKFYVAYDNFVKKEFPDIENLKNITFSEVNNYIAFQYSLVNDSNNYVKIYNPVTGDEKTLGPYASDIEISEILLTGDGKEVAIVLNNKESKKYYLQFKDKIYDIGLGGKIKFEQVTSGYNLLVVYAKEEFQNNERIGKIQFAILQ